MQADFGSDGGGIGTIMVVIVTGAVSPRLRRQGAWTNPCERRVQSAKLKVLKGVSALISVRTEQ